jgi:hypothetical protein
MPLGPEWAGWDSFSGVLARLSLGPRTKDQGRGTDQGLGTD